MSLRRYEKQVGVEKGILKAEWIFGTFGIRVADSVYVGGWTFLLRNDDIL